MMRVLFFFYTDSSGVFAKNVQTANGWASLKYVCRLAARLSFPSLFDFETLLFAVFNVCIQVHSTFTLVLAIQRLLLLGIN